MDERLTVGEAAARLGISTESVRQKIRRGSLRGEKSGGRVYVILNASEGCSDSDATGCSDGDSNTHPNANAGRSAAWTPSEHHRETMAILRAEIEFLRGELATRTLELERRDVLLREALAWRAALPAPQAPIEHRASEPRAKPRWRLWQWLTAQ